MFSVIVLVSFQGVFGTFPPVSNPPPIPGQSVRILDTSPDQFYVLRNVNQEAPQPTVRGGSFAPDIRKEQRHHVQDTLAESIENSSAVEGFNRFYPNGEPAVGPVATPLPDVSYVAQPSITSKINPGVLLNTRSNIWVLTRGRSNEYVSEQWIPVPNSRVVRAKQTNLPTSVNPVVSPSVISSKRPFTSSLPGNTIPIITKVSNINLQKVPTNPSVNGVPTPIIEIPKQDKQIIQQFSKDSIILPAQQQLPTLITPKKTFSAPPPPPPLIKGSAKSEIDVPVPDRSSGTITISGKNGLSQQIRHIWVPTSSRTGRFISIPISRDSKKCIINKGIQENPATIGISDAWILKEDNLHPRFEQKKLFTSPIVAKSGITVIQNPFLLNRPAETPIFKTDSPISPIVVEKNINSPLDVWPVRNDFINAKSLDKTVGVAAQADPNSALKSINTFTEYLSSSPTQFPVLLGKNTNINVSPNVLSSIAPIVKRKLHPVLPQTSQFFPRNPSFLSSAAFRLLTAQNIRPLTRLVRVKQNRQPLTRIIRINRNPSGSYYLLNTKVQPNTLAYPPFLVRQSVSTIPTWLVTYSLPKQQIIPTFPSNPTSPLPFSLAQTVKHAKTDLVAGKGLAIPQADPIKVTPVIQNSESTKETSSAKDSDNEEKNNDVKEKTFKKEENGELEEQSKEGETEGEELALKAEKLAVEAEETESKPEETNKSAEN